MKTRAYWIAKARERYEIARRLARVQVDPDVPLPTRKVAEFQCKRAIAAAGRFEEMALGTKEGVE